MCSADSPLPRSFFSRPAVRVARDLVGAVLFVRDEEGLISGRIVEVEAYGGSDDPASHAARGPTPRSAIMFASAGIAYVYFIYGMHHCLNVVTDVEGRAGAVLIRAVEPLTGLDVMTGRRRGGMARKKNLRRAELTGGPGRLCRAFGIDGDCNGLCVCDEEVVRNRRIWIGAHTGPPPRMITTPRVGIRTATRRRHRFIDGASDCLSVPIPRSDVID